MASEALQRILASVGPLTVVRYLNYAIGNGIGVEDEGPGADAHAAVGLEHIGKDLSPQVDDEHAHAHSHYASSHAASVHMHMHTAEPELDAKLGEMHLREQLDDGASLLSLPWSRDRPAYFYGAVGNRIGEAAACFLARWGVDLFAVEEDGLRPSSSTSVPSPPPPLAFAAPSPSLRGTTGGINISTMTDAARIWARALSARWVRGLISSDTFFVQGELKRYEFARRVVELRRGLNGVTHEEEREWRKLFEEGIYYSNLVSGLLFSWVGV